MKNRLEEIRKERGIKQEELAAALEVSRQTIGSLENGRYNPSITLAFKLARYFDMSIEDIKQNKNNYLDYIILINIDKKTAEILGTSRKTVYNKIHKYQIRTSAYRKQA